MLPPDLEISTDPARIDVDVVYKFLSTSYWAETRPREVVERSIANSIPFGAYTAGRQVAFAPRPREPHVTQDTHSHAALGS